MSVFARTSICDDMNVSTRDEASNAYPTNKRMMTDDINSDNSTADNDSNHDADNANYDFYSEVTEVIYDSDDEDVKRLKAVTKEYSGNHENDCNHEEDNANDDFYSEVTEFIYDSDDEDVKRLKVVKNAPGQEVIWRYMHLVHELIREDPRMFREFKKVHAVL